MLVIADGAVWIWSLVDDRFQDAVQRLDLWHANSYLWAVAIGLLCGLFAILLMYAVTMRMAHQ